MHPKVLIVDDSASARHFITQCFSGREVELFEARNGQEALDLFDEIQPSVVFLDLTMPVMDGFEALEHLRKRSPDIPVIVLTADVQKKTLERIHGLGATELLKKPPKREALLETFDKCIEASV